MFPPPLLSAFFAPVSGRVFRGQKINGLLFKISGSDFKIRATNFFFSPMWGKRSENQFSIFRTLNARFGAQVLRRTMSVLYYGTAVSRCRTLIIRKSEITVVC